MGKLMDIYAQRDLELNESHTFWQQEPTSVPLTYLYEGYLVQQNEEGAIKGHYFLSNSYFIKCQGQEINLGLRSLINWKRFEQVEDQQFKLRGFRLFAGNCSETFYAENVGEHSKWVYNLSRLCVMQNLNQDFEVLNTLGRGAFSVVKRALNKASGEEVAVKLVDKSNPCVLSCLKEVDLLRRFNHESIIKVIAVYDTPTLCGHSARIRSRGHAFESCR
mmetsp:Transcript_15493/g.28111  ORF Transcript_15493/g.28111 Transcript_15493/m.28111 type:complete len:219 (+) Transcript_15493:922-1578(+)